MHRPFNVVKGNNVPIHAPLYRENATGESSIDTRLLTITCRVSSDVIKKYLKPTPFEYVDDKLIITIMDCSNFTGETGGYFDCGIIVPAKYKDINGGYFLFEYEDQDYSIAAGREWWGYPKVYGKVSLIKEGNNIKGSVVKNEKEILRVNLELDSDNHKKMQEINIYPHLLLHTIPNGDGPGIFSQRIMTRNTSLDFQLKSERIGNAKVELIGNERNPLDELQPLEVIGGSYQIGDFHLTEKNGWAKVIDTIV